MKNLIESSKPIRNEDPLTLKLGKSETLNLDAMKCIRGGDGEDDGSGAIIAPYPR